MFGVKIVLLIWFVPLLCTDKSAAECCTCSKYRSVGSEKC